MSVLRAAQSLRGRCAVVAPPQQRPGNSGLVVAGRGMAPAAACQCRPPPTPPPRGRDDCRYHDANLALDGSWRELLNTVRPGSCAFVNGGVVVDRGQQQHPPQCGCNICCASVKKDAADAASAAAESDVSGARHSVSFAWRGGLESHAVSRVDVDRAPARVPHCRSTACHSCGSFEMSFSSDCML